MHNSTEGFAAAVKLSHSLFSTQKVPLGVEHSLGTGQRACELWVDAERQRFVRRPIVEMLNSAGEWELQPAAQKVSLGKLLVRENERWVPALTLPRMLDGRGFGNLCKLREKKIYGREVPLATILPNEQLAPVKWLRKICHERAASSVAAVYDRRTSAPSHPSGGHGPPLQWPFEELEAEARAVLPEIMGGASIDEIVQRGSTVSARLDFSSD